MQIVIDQTDFQRLAPEIKVALMQALGGEEATDRTSSEVHWRRPVDLRPDQAARLVHGLTEDHWKRLELFTGRGGRVSMREIQEVWGDPDLRAASEFQKAMTRRVRRLIRDPEKKAQLIGWDFDATKWDSKKTTIVDGVYYVSEATAKSLRSVMKPGKKRQRKV